MNFSEFFATVCTDSNWLKTVLKNALEEVCQIAVK